MRGWYAEEPNKPEGCGKRQTQSVQVVGGRSRSGKRVSLTNKLEGCGNDKLNQLARRSASNGGLDGCGMGHKRGTSSQSPHISAQALILVYGKKQHGKGI